MKKIFGIIAFISVVCTAFAALLYKKYLRMDKRKGFCGEVSEENQKWLDNHPAEDQYMISRDNYCLHSVFYDNHLDNWVILVHGYDAEGKDMTTYTRRLYEEGYSVLVIDQRGCGLSGDRETTMGHLEKYDVIDWAKKITDERGAKNIMLMGVSMGAATVMLASAEEFPETIRCITEDCGYTSVKDEFEYSMKNVLHLPPYPILLITDIITKFKKGWSFLKDADCIKAVSHAKVPILFIHGKSDTFVPYLMQDKLFNACRREDKEILSIDEAEHTEAVKKAPDLYWSTVLTFIEKHFVK